MDQAREFIEKIRNQEIKVTMPTTMTTYSLYSRFLRKYPDSKVTAREFREIIPYEEVTILDGSFMDDLIDVKLRPKKVDYNSESVAFLISTLVRVISGCTDFQSSGEIYTAIEKFEGTTQEELQFILGIIESLPNYKNKSLGYFALEAYRKEIKKMLNGKFIE